MRRIFFLAILLATAAVAVPAQAQYAPTATTFKDTSMLKPPYGTKVAVWEFEDLECPACARAFPIVHEAVKKYNIPLLRHDYPLPMHIWSFDAAVNARYIQDVVKNPALAEEYRGKVFAAQNGISNKDDLRNFTQHFAAAHHINWPFFVDPGQTLAAKVKTDKALGDRIGLTETPTIFVVTNYGIQQVQDMSQLYQTIDAALASVASRQGKTSKK
ncbi:MAG: thioredoxin domain-containing protein [Acidobacteriaceae bacterium]|jgi:thiol-disulfide isomerase/thioredoxin|nr:thioredoxin domain-containing protein [Acidobacteriaceae bacterium]